MIGAIIGDIIGSRFERHNIKQKEFELFTDESQYTDDTVLTIAVADCILNQKDYAETIKKYGNNYPYAGYGGNFIRWLAGEITGPYNSWGNGSAMRVCPIAYISDDEKLVLEEAKKSAEITHNHPEGIKGAQAVTLAIFLARNRKSKEQIKHTIEKKFNYDLSRHIDDIREIYKFDVSCQGSVPEAIIAFLESTDFEDAIRTAISIGGDSDTIACITGAISQAYYQSIPNDLIIKAKQKLPANFNEIINQFEQQYSIRY